ncbi:MAG: pseudouridine synthase [Patescibacteria group bacterium]
MSQEDGLIRLSRFLSDSGSASRRQADKLIKAGQVTVNGVKVMSLGTKINPRLVKVSCRGKLVRSATKVYYLLNKPVGYICSVRDPHNPKTVLTLVPPQPKVWPVGRLDMDSSGLLLLTNDGDLTFQLTHPKFSVVKTYLVKVDKQVRSTDLIKLKQGIRLTEGLAKADQVSIQGQKALSLSIHQGWKRQIRRMLAGLGYNVVSLTRVQEGNLSLGNLAVGKYKILQRKDIK